MPRTIKDVEKRIDELVAQAQTAMGRVSSSGSSFRALESEDWAALRAPGLAFIEATLGRDDSYYREFDKRAADSWRAKSDFARVREVYHFSPLCNITPYRVIRRRKGGNTVYRRLASFGLGRENQALCCAPS